jgi:outer membrane protein assembly factor BamB
MKLPPLASLAMLAVPVLPAQWLQWGGPNRNFTSSERGLAEHWPAEGPRKQWQRPLGEGHSSILVDGGRLYTMYRPRTSGGQRAEEEVIACLDAASGKTVWEHKYPAAVQDLDFGRGAGPHSTPLIVGDRLFATSSRKEILVLDKLTGKLLWSHDLVQEFHTTKSGRGYTCSPLAYRDLVIVLGGGQNQAVMAFKQDSGDLVWKNQSLQIAPASPILIRVDGQDQIVVFGGNEVAGLDPIGGALLWSHPHKTEFGLNISTPLWSPDGTLLISSAYDTGTRLLKLTRTAGQTVVKELWFNNRMRVHIGTVIRIGDIAYGSSGDFGPAFISAIDMKDGRVLWQDRSFSRATFLYADEKLIVLDEEGILGITTVSATGMKVLARAQILTSLSWTVPTLAGKRLYVRDRQSIAAFDVGNPR